MNKNVITGILLCFGVLVTMGCVNAADESIVMFEMGDHVFIINDDWTADGFFVGDDWPLVASLVSVSSREENGSCPPGTERFIYF